MLGENDSKHEKAAYIVCWGRMTQKNEKEAYMLGEYASKYQKEAYMLGSMIQNTQEVKNERFLICTRLHNA